jgi:hypothetical protein
MTIFDRKYQTRAARVALVVTSLIMVLCLVILAVDRVAWALTAMIAAFVVANGPAIMGAWRRGGVAESDIGICNRRMYRSWRWRWTDIERFDHGGSRVYVVLCSGERVPLIGVAQGRRTVWRGGETSDIVGVLNDRLATWRKEQPRS